MTLNKVLRPYRAIVPRRDPRGLIVTVCGREHSIYAGHGYNCTTMETIYCNDIVFTEEGERLTLVGLQVVVGSYEYDIAAHMTNKHTGVTHIYRSDNLQNLYTVNPLSLQSPAGMVLFGEPSKSSTRK